LVIFFETNNNIEKVRRKVSMEDYDVIIIGGGINGELI
jgi:glycerol-3-phosphate dehydrogenase